METSQDLLRQVTTLNSPPAPAVAQVGVEISKPKTAFKQGSVIRYSIDIISVAVVLATVGVQFIAYYQAWPWYTLPVILIGVRSLHLVEHNHTHLRIFRQKFLNEILGYMFFASNGVPVEVYELQHVRNHHRFSQRWSGGKDSDWSSSFGFEGCEFPNKPVSRFYYGITFSLLAFLHSMIEFVRAPGTPIFWSFIRTSVVVLTLSALMIARDPWNWFLFFGLPILIVWVSLGFSNYDHHAGCDMKTPHTAANENLRFFQRFPGFNIGYHVEHHIKPTLHWSQLPKLHQTNKDHIPAENYVLPRFGKIKE
ncbi:MAG TPA: fatty acid desaturase [Pyrinomonadaceae bacterium]|jgi:fatty acid desaturase|nr:fatty acid desaturase [Pyrinomonadaceae bacterium]